MYERMNIHAKIENPTVGQPLLAPSINTIIPGGFMLLLWCLLILQHSLFDIDNAKRVSSLLFITTEKTDRLEHFEGPRQTTNLKPLDAQKQSINLPSSSHYSVV